MHKGIKIPLGCMFAILAIIWRGDKKYGKQRKNEAYKIRIE